MEKRRFGSILCLSKISFPQYSLNDILEREWWIINNLKIGYNDLCNMPWEYIEWFYNRHIQYLVDQEKKRNEQQQINSFM